MPTLPSGEAPPSAQASSAQSPGLVLAPFRGVRYAAERVSGLAEVTSPPYDVIAAGNEDQLIARDPHNVVRLILPRNPAGQPVVAGRPDGTYQAAAADLAAWLADGVLVRDPVPALYVYEQFAPDYDGPAGGTSHRAIQRGLIGALGLRPYSSGVVLPHEDVLPGPVAGRRALMEATRANLEPIFLLYQGGNGLATALVDDVAGCRPALVQATTEDGIRHRLWAITDPAELALVAADLAPRSALIADGHHRYAAYLQVQQRNAGSGPGPWDCGLALLVDSQAYPPHLGAIHRVVEGLAPEAAARQAARVFAVRELGCGSGDLAGLRAALTGACGAGGRGSDGPSFVLAGGPRAWLLTDPDPRELAAAVPDQPADLWQRIGAAVLTDLLLRRVWGIEDDERRVRAVHEPAEAVAAAADGAAADGAAADGAAGSSTAGGVEAGPRTAVLCCPMSAEQVYRVAELGRRVPRKSTSFGPKPRTGLVLRLFADS